MTLVDDLECIGAKRGLEPRSYLRDARVIHRSRVVAWSEDAGPRALFF
jgi:hypothetical protein